MARSIFGRLREGVAALTRDSDGSTDALFNGYWWSTTSATGIRVNQQTALQHSGVMACACILSEDVSKMTPRLLRRSDVTTTRRTPRPGSADPAQTIEEPVEHKGAGREVIGHKDHPLAALLHRPNDWQTWPEFARQMVIAFVLRGNGYAVILRNRRGDPVMLVPINPDRVQMWQAPDGSLFWMVTRSGLHELFVLRNEPFLIPYENVFHLKDLSGDGLVGSSRIALQCETIALGIAQRQQYARLIGNGARPSGILTTDQRLTETSAQRLRDQWNAVNQGLVNSGKTAVLEQGLKWMPLGVSSVDLQFLQLLGFNIIDICRIFRVPPHMLGDMSKGTFNNIVQQSQEYRNNTLTSHTDIWEHRFDFTFDLADQGLFVDFDESALLKADLTARYNAYRVGILTGFETQNEVRVAEGLPPMEGADELLRPVNMIGSDQGGDNPGAGKPSEKVTVDDQPLDAAPGV